MSKQGHPLPDSDEARHDEIPEHLEREKGRGDDSAPAARPEREAVNPDGEPYPSGDLGRGPVPASDDERQESAGAGARIRSDETEFASDLAAHQDRGQGTAEQEADDR